MRTLTLVLTCVVLNAGLVSAADDLRVPLTTDLHADVAEPLESLEAGGIILDGRYIPPPYTIVAVADGVELNGHFVPEAGFNERSRQRRNAPHQISFAARIHRRLADGAWLLGWEEGEYGIFSDSRIADILSVLGSDSSTSEKVDELDAIGTSWVERADWQLLVEHCQVPASVLSEYTIGDASIPDVDARLSSQIAAPLRNFHTSIYLLTVFGISATVFALGTLLSYRPGESMPWSQINPSKDASQLVLRSIALLIGLAVLDLVCTNISAKTVGFWELNPLGAIILSSPFMLGSFKIGATVLSGSILFVLRRYHGAQVASWWLALFCTVLAIRWVTFNSMFLA